MTTPPASATLPMIGWIDEPASEAIVGPDVRVTGWALAASRIRAVELRMDGVVLTARFGMPRHDVADVRPGYPDNPDSGFEFDARLDAHPPPPGVDRRRMTIVALAHDGSEMLLGERTLVESRAHARWRFAARDDVQPFYLLPAVSGVAAGGPYAMNTRYAAYASSTLRVGMRVPILYLRTTQGAAGDYAFDADFDIWRRSANRAIADDSLSHVLAHSAAMRLPVLVTLNGGIWSDAAGTAPEWDLTDKLEEDPANCQWNERDDVMADDYLKDLPGSHAAPELARALTLNVYADDVRRLKKRNLQQAAGPIVAFMRDHPDLFVGVNLDPDVYINPFFSESQWYDYNPGTLRQFREWLAGTGPYAAAGRSGLPDLAVFRREPPLSLHDVSGIARRTFATWDDVDPPRAFPRRADERGISAVDWHHPQWLAISMLIVIGSCTDALLTLVLVERGIAVEANPLMAPLVGHSALTFALVKVALTAGGVLLLTQLARLRAFGSIPVGVFLYLVLGIYGALITYEFSLLGLI